jgi:uncharacterized YccA/Bax inhibitor family protein
MESSNPLLRRENAFSSAFEERDAMTLQGTINKAGILLLLCFAAGAFSWMNPDLAGPFLLVGILGGFVACLVGTFKPTTTPFVAPIYAILEGLALGAISQILNQRYHGIVVNAIILTFGVTGVMLALYASRTIRVTPGLVKGVIAATFAVAGVYLVDIVMRMFGSNVPFLHDSGPIGIGLSLVIIGIAAFNLLLDFATIEDGVNRGSAKYMEWYCGMALLVTLVWLYLEILRLLAKMRGRN